MIYETLSKVQQELKAPKGQYNNFGKYSFRSCEDILEAVKPILAGLKAVIVLSDELTMIGDRYYIKATATLHAGSESVSTTAYAREEQEKKGMDGSQITGSSSSYARKYALSGLLALDDTKDSDATNDGTNAAKTKPKADSAPITYETALEMALTFGKHKGKTLREIYHEDRQYIEYLAGYEKTDANIKAAIEVIETEIRKKKESKANA